MSTMPLSVVSSFATDTLVNQSGKILNQQAGGPAFFIESALKKAKIPYKLFSGKTIGVEILVTPSGEFGRVITSPVQKSTDSLKFSDWAIISTVLDEWRLAEPLPEKLFVDLQGYVRDGKDFGKKKVNETINQLAGSVFCLKGTKEEVGYLSSTAQERQKKQLLVVTDGDKGVEVFNQGTYTKMVPKKVKSLRNTIGAGDTFLAYFVASMYQGNAPETAARYAVDATTDFLTNKEAL